MSTRELAAYRHQLIDIDKARAEVVHQRDAMIREEHANGATVAELSRATGLTRTMLYRILDANTTKGS